MVITGISMDGRGMARISVDGFEAAFVDDEFVGMMRLSQGQEIDEAMYDALHERARFCEAVRSAMRSLDVRDFSAHELIRRLCDKGIGREYAEQAAQYLEDKGYIDDGRYAEQLLERYVGKGYGPMRVRQELMRRGIDRELAQELVDGLDFEEDNIRACFERKYSGADLDDYKERRRVANGLFRNGFGWDAINRLLREEQGGDDGYD